MMTNETMVYDMNMDAAQIEAHTKRGAQSDSVQIEAYAKQDAQYFFKVFQEEGTSVFMPVCFLAQCCMEHNGFMAYINLFRYFRHTGHALPAHYFDIASNTMVFEFYCKKLMYYLVDLSASE